MNILDIVYRRRPRARWLSSQIREIVPAGSSILNVGAGRGFLEKELADSSFEITSIEPGKTDIEKNIIKSPFETAVVDAKFDAIVFSHSLHHLENPVLGIQKALSLLRPNGQLVILEIAPQTVFWKMLVFDSYIICPWRKHTWTRSMLEKLLRDAGGQIVTTRQYNRAAPLFVLKQS